jgi:putative colanic acid biosynthesis acetyltransferase WcaF
MVQILEAKKSKSLEGGPTFTLGNRLARAAWIIVWLTFASWTPRQFAPWRRALLRIFGAQMGARSDVRGTARVWLPSNLYMAAKATIGPDVNVYNMAAISLGEGALVSQNAHLCAGSHDVDDPDFQLIARPISIGAHAWVAADAFIGPGAIIGEGTVVGGRAVAFGALKPWTVYVGNPARPVRARRRGARASLDSGNSDLEGVADVLQ